MSSMKYIKRFITVGISTIILSGCVTPISIEEQSPNPTVSRQERIVISVLDNRKRVVEQGKEKTFIGIAHGAFGIPVDWHAGTVLATEKDDKKKTLSQFLESRLVKGFVEENWDALPAGVQSIENSDEALKLMEKNEAQKLLVVDLKEWYFSINLNWVTAFNFDTDSIVSVYEVQDGQLIEKRFKERDVIEEKADESPQNNILRAYHDQLLQIITDQEVKEALER